MTVLDAHLTASPGASVLPLLALTEPLPGFPRHRDYALVPADAQALLYWLQSVASDGPRFLVASAASFFPDYLPALPVGACDELELADAAEAALYCLVTVPRGDVSASTANLRAPVVVNPAAGLARQVVLADGGPSIRRPLRR